MSKLDNYYLTIPCCVNAGDSPCNNKATVILDKKYFCATHGLTYQKEKDTNGYTRKQNDRKTRNIQSY
jgi:hypothetical protein